MGWMGRQNVFTLETNSLQEKGKTVLETDRKVCACACVCACVCMHLIPTNTTGSLFVEMIATATVGHILLTCV